jgi:hypothetical protein
LGAKTELAEGRAVRSAAGEGQEAAIDAGDCRSVPRRQQAPAGRGAETGGVTTSIRQA